MGKVPTDSGSPESSNRSRNILIGLVVAIALLVIGLILIAVYLVLNANATAHAVEVVRDLFIIVLALTMILILAAVTVLIIQIARFVNLMTNEAKPLITTTQDTINTVRGTAEFVSRHVTEPIVKTSGALGGVAKVVSDVDFLRKAAGIVMEARASGSITGARSQPAPDVVPPAPSQSAASGSEEPGTPPEARGANPNSIQDNF
jgi:membrane protein implicated in regulation of membrane protease activity